MVRLPHRSRSRLPKQLTRLLKRKKNCLKFHKSLRQKVLTILQCRLQPQLKRRILFRQKLRNRKMTLRNSRQKYPHLKCNPTLPICQFSQITWRINTQLNNCSGKLTVNVAKRHKLWRITPSMSRQRLTS